MRSCRQILQNRANINRSQAIARSLLPTQASHIWVSLHNVFRRETSESGSVRSLCSFPAVCSAAAALFIFMMFLEICVQIKSRSSKKKRTSEGKVKIPQSSIFFLCLLYYGKFFFFFQGISSPSVLFREVNTTWTRCAPGLCSQASVSSLHSRPPGGGGEGDRLPAACIMPELFHATGSLNFRIHPRSFAFCDPVTASTPTQEEQGICLPCGSIVTIPMLPSTVTMTCGWMHSQPPPPNPPPSVDPDQGWGENTRGYFLNPDTRQIELPGKRIRAQICL